MFHVVSDGMFLQIEPLAGTRTKLEEYGRVPKCAELTLIDNPKDGANSDDNSQLFRMLNIVGIFGNIVEMAKCGIEFYKNGVPMWPATTVVDQVSQIVIRKFIGLLVEEMPNNNPTITWDPPSYVLGTHHIDLRGLGGNHVVVQYRTDKGWGASVVSDVGFDVETSPDFTTSQTYELVAKVVEFLAV